MYSKTSLICAVCALGTLMTACQQAVSLSTDGSLTQYAVIMLAPAENKPQHDLHAQAYYAREGCKGKVSFQVPRAQAREAYIATLVPDYRREGNEMRRRFVPRETKSILFSQEGITLTPHRRP